MMYKHFTILAAIMMITVAAVAQKPKVESGDFKAISGIKTWNVSIEKEGLEIHKQPPYDEFIKERVETLNKEEEELGDEWVEDWEKNFDRKYVNKFNVLMNKYLEGSGVTCDKNSESAEGSIVIKSYWMWLGYANPMMTKPSKVSSKIHFYDASGKELLVVDMVESPGNAIFVASTSFGFNPEGEYARLTESYAKCGKDLAKTLAKKSY